MTQLRKLMLEEIERRNYSPATARAYVHAVKDFAAYFQRPPDQLGPQHVRQYQAYLLATASPLPTRSTREPERYASSS